MPDETLGVNKETETPEAPPTSEQTTQPAGDGVKTPEQEPSKEEVVEQLLADQTPRKKTVPLEYERFQEINEKSKLFDQFAPLLSKIQQNPAVIDQLAKNTTETIDQKVARIEAELKAQKRAELKKVILDAAVVWPDFTEKWDEMRPLVESLEKRGLSTRDAVQRVYFAVNPDAAKQEGRLIEHKAQEAENRLGTFSSGGSVVRTPTTEETYPLDDADKEFISVMRGKGIVLDEKLYAKHADSIKKFRDL